MSTKPERSVHGFACNFCCEFFFSPIRRVRHEKRTHNFCCLYCCHYCFKRFISAEDKQTHELKHLGDVIENCRRSNPSSIRRPHSVGVQDTHGHIWYCFKCQTYPKNHRSFNSHKEMHAHITKTHSEWIS